MQPATNNKLLQPGCATKFVTLLLLSNKCLQTARTFTVSVLYTILGIWGETAGHADIKYIPKVMNHTSEPTHTHRHHHVHNHSHHSHAEHSGCGCCGCHHSHSHAEGPLWRACLPMMVSGLLLIAGLCVQSDSWFALLIFVMAYLPVSLPVVRSAWGEMRSGAWANEFTLMLLASLGAFAIGEYPEAVGVMLFYAIGEFFQERAVGRARADIRALVSMRPEAATLILPDGTRQPTKPELVDTHSLIEVLPGERVPLDGELLNETAEFDTAALTGEALPRTFTQGAEISAGMIAVGRAVKLRTLRPFADNALQRIMRMVDEAAARKSPAETFIRRFARIYTPAVTLLALLIGLLPPLLAEQAWSVWTYRALVFLVVSCPCALVVSVPLSYYRGIGVASRFGLLFKGGNYLDAVSRLQAVAFDKTGTLTTGQFALTAIERVSAALPALTDTELLRMVAALERFSTHPLAKALVSAAGNNTLPKADNVCETPGGGLCGEINGYRICVGKAEWLQSQGIALPESPVTAPGTTTVLCAINSKYAATLRLADQPRPTAAETIRSLKKMGIRITALLSGDSNETTAAMAQQLHMDESAGNLLPADKAEQLRKLKLRFPQGGVAFVGDGINDAPVLATGDVAFAMGGGTDAAIETADVVVQNADPMGVAHAIAISRTTRRIVKLNITLALGIKLAVILTGALGLTGLWAAVLADTGVALWCVANTYLIQKRD